METGRTKTITRQADYNPFVNVEETDEITLQRLEALLAVNIETARQKAVYHSEKEKLEAELMENPLTTQSAYANFGLILGIFTPAAIFTRFFMEAGAFRNEDVWIFGLLAVVNLITAVVGYFSGKLIGKMVAGVEKYSWWAMLLLLPMIGILWGIITGGAGGVIILIFGAIFGAWFGAMVGIIALPLFTVFHRLLKKGESIEFKHFLPAAFGVTLSICAFILGL